MNTLRRLTKFIPNVGNVRLFSQSCALHREKLDHRADLRSMPHKDEGTQGAGSVEVSERSARFPDESTFTALRINGVPFEDIPRIYVKCSLNNTICVLTDHTGKVVYVRSGGTEGFKHTRKGTTVAAQAAATALAYKAISYSMVDARLILKGLGPGRLASVKGLQMAGLNIVSITDRTPSSTHPPRPRKAKRL